jgi:hypothetical protein
MPYESNLWNWLREGVKPLLAEKRLHICRVENSVGFGYPDIEGCLDGRGFHLELKGCNRPANPETPIRIKWQPGQKPWLKKRWGVGGSCFVLIRVGSRSQLKRYMIRGDQVEKLGKAPESRLAKLSVINPTTTPCEIVVYAATIRS